MAHFTCSLTTPLQSGTCRPCAVTAQEPADPDMQNDTQAGSLNQASFPQPTSLPSSSAVRALCSTLAS